MHDHSKLVSVITSMKPLGLILSIGAEALPVQSAVVDSMDMLSRLVVSLPPDLPRQECEKALENDLRVAIHRQDSVAFLQDVAHHKANLAIVGSSDLSETLLQLIVEMLDEAGCLLIVGMCEGWDRFDSILDSHGRHVRVDSTTVFAKVSPRVRQGRKGGRRSRSPSAWNSSADSI